MKLNEIIRQIGPQYRLSTNLDDQKKNEPYRYVGVIYEIELDEKKRPVTNGNGEPIKRQGTEKMIKILQFPNKRDAERYNNTIKTHRTFNNIENIVTIFGDDIVYVDNVPFTFIMMERGNCDLEDDIKQMDKNESLNVLRQIGKALDSMWREGVVHRDVKPRNIILFKGNNIVYKICDLQTIGLVTGRSSTHGVIGTDTYIAPEQLTNPKNKNSAADLYALGLIHYQSLTQTSEIELGSLGSEDDYVPFNERKEDPDEFYKYLGLKEKIKNPALRQIIEKCLTYNKNHEDYLIIDEETKKQKVDPNKKERPWDGRYQNPKEFLFDLDLVEKHEQFAKFYENLDGINPEKQNVDEALKGFNHYRELILGEGAQYDTVKKKYLRLADNFDGTDTEKRRIFGEVLDIVKGNKHSRIIDEMKKASNQKYNDCFSQISSFIQENKNPEPEKAFVKSGVVNPKIKKYKKFLQYAKENKFEKEEVKETKNSDELIPDDVSGLAVNVSDLEPELEKLEQQYKHKGPESVIVGEIRNKVIAEQKKKEYSTYLEDCRKAKEEFEKETGKNLAKDFKNLEKAVNAEIAKMDAICEDAKLRCSIAKNRFTTEKGSLDYALEVFDFSKCPDEKLMEKLDGQDPVYKDFECVKETEQELRYCDTAIQLVQVDLARGQNGNT